MRSTQNVNKAIVIFYFCSYKVVFSQNNNSYTMHQRQLKMVELPSLYKIDICSAPTRAYFTFLCQFINTTHIIHEAKLVSIENTTRARLAKDTFGSMLTIQEKALYSLKTSLVQLYSSFFFRRNELCTGRLNAFRQAGNQNQLTCYYHLQLPSLPP